MASLLLYPLVDKKKASPQGLALKAIGAEGRTRTGTVLRPLDFESSASANSATSATLRSIATKRL